MFESGFNICFLQAEIWCNLKNHICLNYCGCCYTCPDWNSQDSTLNLKRCKVMLKIQPIVPKWKIVTKLQRNLQPSCWLEQWNLGVFLKKLKTSPPSMAAFPFQNDWLLCSSLIYCSTVLEHCSKHLWCDHTFHCLLIATTTHTILASVSAN